MAKASELRKQMNRNGVVLSQDYINDYVNEVNNFYKSTQDNYSTIGYGNSKQLYDNTNAEYERIKKKGETLRNHLITFGNGYSNKDLRSIFTTIGSFETNSKPILDAYKGNNDFYSQFETEQDYQDYGYYQKYKDYSYSQLMDELDVLTDDKEKDFINRYTTNNRGLIYEMSEDDVRDMISKKGGTTVAYYDNNNLPVTWDQQLVYLADEEMLDKVYSDENNYKQFYKYLENEGSVAQIDELVEGELRHRYASEGKTINEDEINKLVESEGKRILPDYEQAYANGEIDSAEYEAAQQWPTTMDEMIAETDAATVMLENGGLSEADLREMSAFLQYKADRKEYSEKNAKSTQWAYEHPYLAAGANLFQSPIQVVDMVDNWVSNEGYSEVDTSVNSLMNPYNDEIINSYNAFNQGGAQAIYDKSLNKHGKEWRANLARTAYSGLSSAAQSATTAAICSQIFGPSVGGKVALGIMASSAAANKYNEIALRGGTVEEATTSAIVAGIAEAAFEAIPMDKFIKLKDVVDFSNVKSVVTTALKGTGNAIITGLWDANGEALTDLTNNIADRIINRDNSAYIRAVNDYMSAGYTQDEAELQASKDEWMQVLDSAIGGFLGSGATGVTKVGGNTLTANRMLNENKIAGTGITSQEKTGQLIDIAMALPDTQEHVAIKELAKSLQGTDTSSMSKKAAKSYTKEVGRLYNMLVQSEISQYKNADSTVIKEQIRQKFSEIGVENVSDRTVDALYKAYTKQKLSVTEKVAVSSKQNQQVLEHLDKNSERIYNEVDNLKSEGTKHFYELQKLSDSIETSFDSSVDEFSTSDDGKTYIAGTSQAVEIKSIKSVSDNDITVELSDGSTQSLRNVDLGDANDAVIYQGIVDIQNELGANIGSKTANSLMLAYRKTRGNASTFINNAKIALMRGYSNVGLSKSVVSALTPDIAEAIYDLGRDLRKSETARRAEIAQKKTKSSENTTVTLENIDESELTPIQKTSLKAATHTLKKLGTNIVFYHSDYKDGKFTSKYNTKNGSPNGFYNADTNTVYLDIRAGLTGKGTMLFTAAHEMTHTIREWSPESFDTFADFLMEKYGDKNIDVDGLIRDKMRKLKLSYDTAFEEVVADSCESFLVDSNMIENIQELNAKDKGLVNHIISFFKNLLQKVREVYAKLNPDSQEGRYVRNMKDALSELHSKWIEAVKTTSQNISNAQISTTKNTAKNDGVKMQTRIIDNQSVVWIENNVLSNKELHDYSAIADFIKGNIGKMYTIIESGQKVYLGESLPDEYTQSKYTSYLKNRNKSLLLSKNKAAVAIGEMVEIATNRRWEPAIHNDNKDAKYGIYRYDTKFAFPLKNQNGDIIDVKCFDAELLICNASNGKKYLYDIVNIKKDNVNALNLKQKEIRKGSYKTATQNDVSNNIISDSDAKSNSNIKKSERDAVYLEVVKNGDMETAQRMVDEAARDAGYTIKAYHGTRKADFTVFRRNVNYFSSSSDVAQSYAPNDEMYSVYLKMQNPFVLDAKNSKWSGIPIDKNLISLFDAYGSSYFRENGAIRTSVADIVAVIEDAVDDGEFDYDGVIIKNVDDTGSYYKNKNNIIGDDYIVFNRNNVKSADPVTYDDDGNIIPLSKRFNEQNEDIRYSLRGTLDNIEDSFGIKKVNDYVHVQKQVIQALSNEGFFNNNIITVKENDMIVEITKDGIKETLGPGKRYQSIPRLYKKIKLATIRDLPKLIVNSSVIEDDVANIHNKDSVVKYTYLSNKIYVDDVEYEATIAIRKSPQKNKFWVHEIRINKKEQSLSSSSDNLKQESMEFSVHNDNVSQNIDDVKYSERITTDAVNYFGTTYSWAETGYLLTDGRRLDFSGKKHGARPGGRSQDHREILDAYSEEEQDNMSGSEAMVDFMSKGNIRIQPEMYGINLSVAPTKAQETKLAEFIKRADGEVILDIDDVRGNTVVSVEYPYGTKASKILNDIKQYFIDGTEPYVSDTQRFLYQARPNISDMFLDDSDELSDNDAFLVGEYLRNNKDSNVAYHLINNTRNIPIGDGKLRTIVSRLVRSYGLTNIENKDLSVALMSLLESQNKAEVDENTELLRAVFEKVVKESEFISEDSRQLRDEVNEYLKDYRRDYAVYLTDEQISSLQFQGRSVKWLRDKLSGMVNIVREDSDTKTKKTSFGYFMHDLAQAFPEVFSMELVDQVDNWETFIEKMEKINNPEDIGVENAYGMDAAQFSSELASRLLADVVENKYNSKQNAYVDTLVKKLRREHNERVQEVRIREQKKIKDAEQKKYDKLVAEHKRQRENYREGRNKTEIKDKIRNVIKQLDGYLNHGNKKKNVKEGMRDFASKALELADIIFENDIKNEDIINRGVVGMSEREHTYYDKYKTALQQRAIKEERLNKVREHGTWQTVQEVYREIQKIDDEIKYYNTQLKDLFAREKAKIYDVGVKYAVNALADAYANIQNSKFEYISNAYDENIAEMISNLGKSIGDGTRVKDMTVTQLNDVYKTFTAALTTVRNANKLFGLSLSVTETSEHTSQELSSVKSAKATDSALRRLFGDYMYNSMKPVYFFRMLGSQTLEKLFWNLQNAELKWYANIQKAQEFRRQIADKYNYKSWNFDKQFTFKDAFDNEFTLKLEEMMSVYALSKRNQGREHLLRDGFVHDKNIKIRRVMKNGKISHKVKYRSGSQAYSLTLDTLVHISEALTDEQRSYVEVMQRYLSKDMAELGNFVSMQMYGIKQFNEAYYFPIRVSKDFLPTDYNNKDAEVLQKNKGFAKEIQKKAGQPLVLSEFSKTWAHHCDSMSQYNAFVLPLEDIMKVLNYRVSSDKLGSAAEAIKNKIGGIWGDSAMNYIVNFIRDINGGVRTNNITPADKMLSLSKKASVMASASVVIQQPFAVGRAMAYIKPKYFLKSVPKAFNLAQHNKDWAELKKYSPIAGIKEMGYFDTDIGQNTLDWILKDEYKGKEKLGAFFTDSNYRDDVLSAFPAMADELAWVQLWHAVKAEIKDTTDLEGEAYFDRCGERFNEVVQLTQVYDSVFSRSGYMRNKSTFAKMATAFMAEPTVTLNMNMDALTQWKRNGKAGAKAALGTLSAVLVSQIVTGLAKALWTANRDDDEDKKWIEKYFGKSLSEVLSNINPFEQMILVRDVVSMIQGYSVERMDMKLLMDFIKQSVKLKEAIFDDEKEVTAEVVLDTLGAYSNLVGVPLKNIIKDIRTGINLTESVFGIDIDKNKKSDVAIVRDAYNLYLEGKSSEIEENVKTMVEEKYNKYYSEGETEADAQKKARQAVRTTFTREYKDKYLDAFYSGDKTTYTEIRKMLYATGLYGSLTEFDKTIAKWKEDYKAEQEKKKRAEERAK